MIGLPGHPSHPVCMRCVAEILTNVTAFLTRFPHLASTHTDSQHDRIPRLPVELDDRGREITDVTVFHNEA